jgi:hypothetical protein
MFRRALDEIVMITLKAAFAVLAFASLIAICGGIFQVAWMVEWMVNG